MKLRRLVESVNFPTVLSRSQIMSEAEKCLEKKSTWINIGYMRSVDVAARYTSGKIDKLTGNPYPIVKIIKCSEAQYRSAFDYGNLDAVKKRNATPEYQQRVADRQAHYAELGIPEPEKGIVEWIVPNVVGINTRGNEVVAVYPNTKNIPKVKYYISIDNSEFEETDKQTVAQYLTPAKASELLTNPADKEPLSDDDSENIKYRTFILSKIYAFRGEGETFMMTHRKRTPVEDPVSEVSDEGTLNDVIPESFNRRQNRRIREHYNTLKQIRRLEEELEELKKEINPNSENITEEYEIFHNDNGADYEIVERNGVGDALLHRIDVKGLTPWVVAWNLRKSSWGQGHYFADEANARELWDSEYANKKYESYNRRVIRRK